MTDLEFIYRERLEEEIIAKLAKAGNLSLQAAMDAYYQSRLARQIAEDDTGMRYLSADYLVEDLLENETDVINRVRASAMSNP